MAAEDQTPDVLTSLPRTRPQRRSAKRDAAKPAARKPAAKQAAAAKPKAAARPKTAPKAKPEAAAGPKIPPAGFAPPPQEQGGSPSGVELVGTAIQAAGELAQIGAAIGKQALKSALRIGR